MRSLIGSVRGAGGKIVLAFLVVVLGIPSVSLASGAPTLNAPEYDEGNYLVSWSGFLRDYVELWEKPSTSSSWSLRYSGSTETSRRFIKSSNGAWNYRARACWIPEAGWPARCSSYAEKTVTVQLTPSAPGSLGNDRVDQDGSYTLSWSPASGIVTKYKVQKHAGLWFWDTIAEVTGTSFSESGKADGDYRYRVASCNIPGCQYSNLPDVTIYVRNRPNRPQNPQISATDYYGNAILTWDAPASNGSLAYYEIQHKGQGPEFVWQPFDMADATATQLNITGHTEGTYSFRVRACKENPIGGNAICGQWSSAVAVDFIWAPDVSWASPPSSSNDGSVPMSWTVNNVSGADSYKIHREHALEDTTSWSDEVVLDVPGGQTSFTDTLRENGTYRYRVKACNQAGCNFSDQKGITVDITIEGLVDDAEVVDLLVPASEYVGSLSEAASIDGGNVSYSVEMPVPPGRNGMQPKVGLSYSSGGGNGSVGVGWSLDAGSGAVYRCPNIAAAGGETRPYLGRVEDRLCLNGQHLMLVSGSYGQAGSTYRTEITDYATVTLLGGNSLSSGSYFEVLHKSGDTSYYQYAWVPNSGSYPTHWYITRDEDINGNQVDYVYSQGAEPLLQNVYYTGYKGQQGSRNVKFAYEDRPQQEKYYGYKHQGGRDYGTKRLNRIETYYGSTLVHAMDLTYESSALTGRSLLKELQICDANGDCLPKSVYAYNDQPREFALENLVEGEDTQIYFIGDYDGDGKSDSVKEVIEWNSDGSWAATHRYLRPSSKPGTSFPEANIGFALPGKFTGDHGPADMLLDGKRDFLVAGSDQKLKVVSVEYVDGGTPADVETTTVNTNLALSGSVIRFRVADFDADGRPDVLIHYSGANDVVRLNCTDYSEPFSTLDFCGSVSLPDPGDISEFSHYSLSEIADFNEDGLPDLLFSGWNENRYGGLPDDLIAYTQKQDTSLSFSDFQVSPYQVASTTRVVGLDANGDGLQDRLMLRESGSPVLQINDGSAGYITAEVSGSFGVEKHLSHGVLSIDYDGDGKDELLIPDSLAVEYCFTETQGQGGSQGGDYAVTYCNGGNEAYRFSAHVGRSQVYNRAIFTYRKLSFDWSNHTSVSLSSEATGLELPLGQSQVCDANGDGLVDICYNLQEAVGTSTSGGVIVSGHYQASLTMGTYAWVNTRAASSFGDDALAYAINGLGQERFWQYSPLAGLGSELCEYGEEKPFYAVDRSANTSGHYHFGSTMPVVSRYASSNGVGGMNSRCYRYEDAMYSTMGRGYQGFRTISVDAQVEGESYSTITRTEYHDQFPLTGRVKQAEVRLSSDSAGSNPLSRSSKRWNWQYYPDTGIYQVFPQESIEETFDLESRNPLGKETVFSRYHVGQDLQYGNLSRLEAIKESYLGGVLAVRSRADIDYQYDYGEVSSGWTDKLERKTVTTQATEYFGELAAILPDGDANGTKVITTDYQYWNEGRRRLKRETLQQGVASEESFQQFDYDQYGNLTLTTLGAPGEIVRVGSVVYHPDGYFPKDHYNALGHKTRTWYDERFGVVNYQLSPNMVPTHYRYDDMGALYKVERDGQQPVNTATQFCDGGCPALAVSKKITVQNGSPVVTEYLDVLGRVIRTETQAFEGNPAVVSLVQYDAHGRKVAESQPSHNGPGEDFVRYEDFDELGRYRRKLVDRSGHLFGQQQWNYDYNGLSTTITLPDGSSTATRVIDANGRLLSTTDAAGSSTHYRYDGLGRKVLIQDQLGNQVRYYFDNLGRKVSVEDPDAGTAQMPASVNLYNGFGEVLSTTNANGDVLAFDYDKLGRITHRYVNGELEVQWTYDEENKPGTLSQVEMLQEDYLQKVFYDDLARPIRTETVFNVSAADGSGRQQFVTQLAYDGGYGRVKGKYFSSGEYVEFRYDKYGNLVEQRDPVDDTDYYRVTGVNARGQVLAATYGNGLALSQGYYDSTGDVQAIQVNGALGSLLDLHYEYADPFGNLTTRENRVAGVTEVFQYDAIQRLQQSSKTWSGGIPAQVVDYDYDTVGNITLKSDFGTDYQYGSADRGIGGNAGPHAVRSVEKPDGTVIADFQYDNAGNMIAGNGRATVYSAYNKPLQVQENGQTTFFTYGPDLELIKREDGDRTVYYGSGGMQRVIEGGEVTERTPVSANVQVENGPQGRKVRYQHYDRLGSLALVTDEGGQVTESHGYDAFGKALEGDWRDTGGLLHSGENAEELTEKGFTGHEHLDKHKLVHMGGRIYDPLLGRFMSVDPYIQSETSTQNQNPYSYVMNNPLSMVDPSGYRGACTNPTSSSGDDAPVSCTTAQAIGEIANSGWGPSSVTTVEGSQDAVLAYVNRIPSNGKEGQSENQNKDRQQEKENKKKGEPKCTNKGCKKTLWESDKSREKRVRINEYLDFVIKNGTGKVEAGNEGVVAEVQAYEIGFVNRTNGGEVTISGGQTAAEAKITEDGVDIGVGATAGSFNAKTGRVCGEAICVQGTAKIGLTLAARGMASRDGVRVDIGTSSLGLEFSENQNRTITPVTSTRSGAQSFNSRMGMAAGVTAPRSLKIVVPSAKNHGQSQVTEAPKHFDAADYKY